MTVTVAEQFPGPPAPAVVARYVVVAAGVTVRTPLPTGRTVPIPWLSEIDVAFVVVQPSDEDPPAVMDDGDAVSVHPEAGAADTFTVVEHVPVPPAPVTVPV